MHKRIVSLGVGCLIALTACTGTSGSGSDTPASLPVSPSPVSLADWWNKQGGAQTIQLFQSSLNDLDEAVSNHSVEGVRTELELLAHTRTIEADEQILHPISNIDANNRWTAILFDFDGVSASYEKNVVESNFAHLADAQITEATFKKNLSDFEAWVKLQIGAH